MTEQRNTERHSDSHQGPSGQEESSQKESSQEESSQEKTTSWSTADTAEEPIGSGSFEDDRDQTEKDRSYAPGSDRDVAAKQEDQGSENRTGIDENEVELAPGTGGPDDQGDVDVDESELNRPHMDGARTD